jgi:hypothetical protein
MGTIEWLNNLCLSEVNFVSLHQAPARVYPMRNKGRRHHGLIFTFENTEILTFDDREIKAIPWSIVYIPKGAQYNLALIGESSNDIFIDFVNQGTLDAPVIFHKCTINEQGNHRYRLIANLIHDKTLVLHLLNGSSGILQSVLIVLVINGNLSSHFVTLLYFGFYRLFEIRAVMSRPIFRF